MVIVKFALHLAQVIVRSDLCSFFGRFALSESKLVP